MKKVFLFYILIFISFSCSLRYDEQSDTAAVIPELQMKNARLSQYKDDKISMRLDAKALEQYKSDNSTYGRDVEFESWNKDGELETEGKCGLLGINRNSKIYTLFNNIILNNKKQNFKIQAENLKWDSNTEQLVSGKNDRVFVTRDDIEIEGKGFSASGVSQSFEFSERVTGIITTDDDTEEKRGR